MVYSGEVSKPVKVPTVLSEPVTAIPQGCILDEFDCSQWWTSSLSFIHLLSAQLCQWCSFVEKTASAVVEGCHTFVNRLVFVHDWTNTDTVTTCIA